MKETLQSVSSELMAKTPLFPVAAGMVVGIVADRWLEPSAFLAGVLLTAATIPVAVRRCRIVASPVWIGLAALAAGCLLHWSVARVVSASSIERLAEPLGRIVRLHGVIASEPRLVERREGPFERWRFQSDETAFLLRLREIQSDDGWSRVTGLVRVFMREAVFDLREGERVEVFGRLASLSPPRNPGVFDWRDYYRRQGVVARLYCDHRENVTRLDRAESTGWAWIGWMRRTARGLLTDDIAAAAPEEASFLEAMVLGHRSRFDRRLDEVFTRAGCIHFIAVSGTNIVILIAAVWFVARLLGIGRRRAALAMAVTVVLYTILAEPRPPVLRACVMGLLFCTALLLRRRGAHFNWICAAAIILCILDPQTVFDVGFQLSFGAVLGVAYLAPALLNASREAYWSFRHWVLRDPFAREDARLVAVAERDSPTASFPSVRRVMTPIGRFVSATVAVSAGAWLCGLPITAATFQQVQPWGAPNTLLVYPLMSVVMILGLLKIVAAAVSPALEAILSSALGWTDQWMIRVVERLAELPGSSSVVDVPPWWLLAAYGVFLLLFAMRFGRTPDFGVIPRESTENLVARAIDRRRKRWHRSGWWASLVVLVVCGIAWIVPEPKEDRLTVTVLAVGSGSATVIELPDGNTIVYDAGTVGGADVGESVVVPFLRKRGIRRLEQVHVSHPDLDHYGGVPTLTRRLPTGRVVLNPCFAPAAEPRSAARHFIDLLASNGVAVQATTDEAPTWEQAGVRIDVLWPPAAKCASLNTNDSSTVLKLSYAGHSILLTGDIEDAAQKALMERGGLEADVLILPHHGSVRPTTSDFLRAVGARASIRSSGQRLDQTDNGIVELAGDTPLFNTADVGAVRIEVDSQGVRVAPITE